MLRLLLRQFLFSNSCSICGTFLEKNKYLCDKCNNKLRTMSELKKRKNLYYLYYYTDVKEIIFDLKFKNRKDISKDLGEYIKNAIDEIIKIEKIDVVIPVPASKKRILERGYNQVDEILKNAEVKFNKIKRVKNTKKMYKIKDSEKRKQNVKNAFFIENNYEEKNILLVDDIATTGATLNELKFQLENENKVNNVIFFSIAVVKKYFK